MSETEPITQGHLSDAREMLKNTRDCVHGHLARSCDICFLEKENKRLRELVFDLLEVGGDLKDCAESLMAYMGDRNGRIRKLIQEFELLVAKQDGDPV